MSGKVELILGPMFSGKTTLLLSKLRRAEIAGKKVLLIRPKIDTRDYLQHDNLKHNFRELFVSRIGDHPLPTLCSYDVIGVDEGQFIKCLRYDTHALATCFGKHVIISGLVADAFQQGFPEISATIPISDEIIKLNAVCVDCGSEYGSCTWYKGEESSTEAVRIGGADLYESLCRHCYRIRCIKKEIGANLPSV